ncbi:uncharacterized protein LOC118233484 [Anguilla anguilla]|uniref:uncharacterized protein LOC118233484 n=1 Tax=Anguilla anguilla TaxID=7936 RepID=UPI0015AC7EF9|nr:uncharacterized protein LOC118233484 [Anguilla anguilla]
MASKTLILLVILCLWEGLWVGGSVSKVVRRRRVRSHAPATAEVKPAVDQWDSSLGLNAAPPSAADARLVIRTEAAPIAAVAPPANQKAPAAENANFAPKPERRPTSNPDSAVHTGATRGGPDPDQGGARNGSKGLADPSGKREHDSKVPLFRRPDFSYRGNRTRFRSLVRSRVTPDLTVLTTVAQRRGRPSDPARRANLTENRAPPKPGPREGPAPPQKQDRTGPGVAGTGRGRKQDLVPLGRVPPGSGVSAEPGQEGAVTPTASQSGGRTARSDPRAAVHPDSDPDPSVHTRRGSPAGVTPDSGGGAERPSGPGSEAPDGDRYYSAHATLTMHGDAGGDWNTVSSGPRTDLLPPPPPPLSAVTLEPRGDGNQSRARTEEEPESGVALNSVDGRAQSDAGHVLKLRPHPGLDLDLDLGVGTETGERGVTVDSWLGGRGLVFEEAEEGRGQRGAETRSRSRRSWIWNQFFVIEEYSGPEPVLIGRVSVVIEGESGDTFNISTSGREAVITLNKAVDYESRTSYSFSVEVLNPTVDPRFLRRGPFKDRASVRVAVLDADEPPRFSRARYRLDVMENCPPSCTVGRVSAVDPDTGLSSNIRFSIDPQSDPEALFRIAADSGLISTATELDREREQWHNLTVIATQRDSPSQVSRVEVAIETLDVNDNAPELDRQYTTALCDSAAAGQVVQVVRAIDKDKGGNDTAVLFSIPAESRAGRNFTIRESGGPTASLVLLSSLSSLPRSPSSSLTLQVPLVLKDSLSGLSSTGTVTVSVCPCLRGGARAGERDGQTDAEWERETVCLPLPSSSPSPGLSTAALLAILACVATLMAVSALSLSLRRQKRDSLSPLEEDDVRENIITYDDEGGGEADTAAFDMAALQRAPHSARRGYRTLDSRNARLAQQSQDQAGGYGWVQSGAGLDPPLYGRLCYSSHTLPALRHAHSPAHGPAQGRGLAELTCNFPTGALDHSLVIQNQGAVLGPGAVYLGPAEPQQQDGPTGLDGGKAQGGDVKDRGGAPTGEPVPRTQQDQDLDWNHSPPLSQSDQPPPQPGQAEMLPKDTTLVQTRQGGAVGGAVGGARGPSASSTLPSAGRRASRTGLSPKQGGGVARGVAADSGQQGEPQRDYPGTLGRAGLGVGGSFGGARPNAEGGISVTGTPACRLYPDGPGLMVDWRERAGIGYSLGRRDMTPQLLPYPGQNRGMLGQLGYRGGWGPGMEAGRGGANSLALRVGEFLRLRLAQVTFDPTQPPYDSVQIYGLEGEGSRAGSLSSLESEGEKEVEKEWGRGLEEWGPQFQRLAELFREREREKEGEREKKGEDEKEEEDKEKEEEKEEVNKEEENKAEEVGSESNSENK